MTKENNQNPSDDESKQVDPMAAAIKSAGAGLPVGVAVGAGIGVAMGNLPMGFAIGIPVGILSTFGLTFFFANSKKK